MMNLNLLFWASDVQKDERFKEIAMAHADMTMEHHIRPDGSVIHIVNHHETTGEPVEIMAGQGYSKDSSWSRGQAWAIYGFALAYIHTGKQAYLDTAKKVAHYFIAATCEDNLPRLDFRCPEEPVYYDSTAGMIAACGLIELSNLVPEYEKRMYFRAAMRLLRNIEKNFCDWNEDTDAVVTMGSERYDTGKYNLPIIYGDFFFTEALYKLRGNSLLFW
jgi:unsaturated chondroitin disaccharide hydrolase